MCNSYLSFDLKLVMIAILNLLSKISTSLKCVFPHCISYYAICSNKDLTKATVFIKLDCQFDLIY